jgi:hypothetical protein
MGHGGNVIAELTVDHHEVDELFIRIEAQPARDTRRRELVDELTVEFGTALGRRGAVPLPGGA